MKSFAAIIATASAVSINGIHSANEVDGGHPWTGPIYESHPHMNEDPHSVPAPLRGQHYLTSTEARFIAENSTANAMAAEPKGDQWWYFNYGPYNADAKEYVQLPEEMEDETMVMTNAESGSTWRVMPDYGEKDFNIVLREQDIANGKKFSGWENPLAWHDDGSDDDLVL